MKGLADAHGGGITVEPDDGKLIIMKGEDTVEELEDGSKFANVIQFGKPVYLSPVVADGILYVGTMTHLYAIKADDK